MKKLIKKLVLWHCRNYRLNTPEKIFTHLSKHFDDYNYFICMALDILNYKGAIKDDVFLLTKIKINKYAKLYLNEFGGKYSIFGGFWPRPLSPTEKIKTIENKKQFLRFIAEKEGKK
jgi:hypothetical protein